ncbi:methyltransferase [Histoplasma capsulatum G186AR]|uniref:Velvet complex subunit laeA n=2 Tax=Ajellomyces capsulatus TaxID=5037 RepID=C0NEY5_AJECG|nr:methyltransferase [Histoplasma capsulatum G186AR]EEH09806.1 methyltransferase [Histoplasma capsulatum G186AR]KAG5298827.1 methyltransferase [Histoplasma capsulatum]QSS73180.1 methyltransferase [Histoplasma capsulatum G186AR]
MDLSALTDLAPRRQPQTKPGFGSPKNETHGSANPTHTEEYPCYEENGRLYHGFRRGIYMYPCDELERDRLDIFHKVFLVARGNALHDVPISKPSPILSNAAGGPAIGTDHGPRILDLGCGTGMWAVEMASRYPHAYVLGIDLAAMQPHEHPPNCDFQTPRDYESPWFLGENSWDMIHLQMGCGSVSNWPNLYQKVIRHLRPGKGYFEQVEIDFEPRCHDEFPADQPLNRWYLNLKDATDQANRPIAHNRSTTHMLKEAGFVDIKHLMFGLPLNTWPDDKYEKEVGKWHNFAFTDSTYALILGPLSRVKGFSLEQIDSLAQEARAQAFDKRLRAFNLLHIYTARRPENPVR